MTRSMISSLRWLAVVVFLFTASSSRAQFAISGMGTGGRESGQNVGQASNSNGSFTAWGGTGGAYYDFAHLGPLHLGADGRFFIEHSGNSTPYGNKLEGGSGGLRADAHIPLVPLIPYVQAEVGGAGTNNGAEPTLTTGFLYQVQFGLDITILPHVDLRGEYGVGQILLEGNDPTLQQFGGGLVLRL